VGRVTRIHGRHSAHDVGTGLYQRLLELAAAQHGVVSRRQLLQIGLTRDAIKHRIARGDLVRVQRCVYAIGHERLSRKGRWMAAVLTYGDGVLSHRSAAAHWDLLATAAARIDISLPSHRDVRAREGIRIHHVRLGQGDRTIRDAIPTTTPMRTLLDLADVVSASRVREAYERSLNLGLFDMRAVESLLVRSPGRRGLKLLCELIAEASEPPILRSKLERRFLELCRSQALPLPATNVVVEGFEVDALWPRARLIAELDSRAHHSGPQAFERDRVRDERLALAGYRVLRFTDRRLKEEPSGVAAAVRAMLDR
jgi:very-short-patch-repair endonuclease